MIVTGTEVEALHLEQNLVKRHRPPFNVRLRDDKSFPYIAVTVEDDYPRVMFTRERHRRGVVYFGPYANAKKVRETLDVLNRVFRFRPCEGPKPGRHSGIPCLDFHIDRCFAPCVDYISKEDYGKVIDGVIEFLSGGTRPIIRELERRMAEAAADERFEEAARFRTGSSPFGTSRSGRRPTSGRWAPWTSSASRSRGRAPAVQVFPLRDGKMVDRYAFHLENVEGQDVPALLEAFGARVLRLGAVRSRHRSSSPARRGTRPFWPSSSPSAVALVSRCAAPSAVRSGGCRSSRTENAGLALEAGTTAKAKQSRLRRVEALEELREVLNLESLPLRIECFDVSNIQEESPVASMVVFQDATPKQADYRKFGIRGAWTARTTMPRSPRPSPGGSPASGPPPQEEYDEGFAPMLRTSS